MIKLKKSLLTATAVAVAAGAIGFGINAARGDDGDTDDGLLVVDWSVPQHALLDDVLAIDAERDTGGFGFSYVPKTRPEALRRLTLGTSGASIVDGYQLGDQPAQLFVEFAEQPTNTCETIKGDPGSGVCLRETRLAAAADNTKFRNMTIYLSQVGTRTAAPDDPATSGIRQFWATAELTPVTEATWFTDLVAEAKAAPKKKVG